MEAEVDASGDTIKRAMNTMEYQKCVACTKSWTAPATVKQRLKYTQTMLKKYPTLDN